MEKKQKPDWFYDKTGSRKFYNISGDFEAFILKLEKYIREKYMGKKTLASIEPIKVSFYVNGKEGAFLVHLEAKPIQTLFNLVELKRRCEGKAVRNSD